MMGATTRMTRKKGSSWAEDWIEPGGAHSALVSEGYCKQATRSAKDTTSRKGKEDGTYYVIHQVEEGAFDGDQEEAEREVATVLEEAVVEEASLGSPPLVQDRDNEHHEPDHDRAVRVGALPSVGWIGGPREAHQERDQAGDEQAVADPVERANLLPQRGLGQRARGRLRAERTTVRTEGGKRLFIM
jgi:hypothetical protein